MNMTADTRATAFIRKLRVGDKFNEPNGNGYTTFEVAREPKVVEDEVHVYLKSLPAAANSRSRCFAYAKDARVKIV